MFPAIGITLVQNRQVTGNWTTLPYTVSQYQYGVPAALTFQTPPVSHHELTPQQQLDYRMQSNFLGRDQETFSSYLTRLGYRIRFYRFFFLPPLYLALVAFLITMREYRFYWAAATLIIFALGVNFFPAWQYHYIAAETCLFVLISVLGLQQLTRYSRAAVIAIVCLCIAHFLFWYGVRVFRPAAPTAGQSRRMAVRSLIDATKGKQLVFVHYGPQHIFQEEWVWNEADIDASRVVWARDLGDIENQSLRNYYPGRTVWLLDADARPFPKLDPYPPPPPPPPVAPVTMDPPKKPAAIEGLHFEPVPQGR